MTEQAWEDLQLFRDPRQIVETRTHLLYQIIRREMRIIGWNAPLTAFQ